MSIFILNDHILLLSPAAKLTIDEVNTDRFIRSSWTLHINKQLRRQVRVQGENHQNNNSRSADRQNTLFKVLKHETLQMTTNFLKDHKDIDQGDLGLSAFTNAISKNIAEVHQYRYNSNWDEAVRSSHKTYEID